MTGDTPGMVSLNGTLGDCLAHRQGIRATCLTCWHHRELDLAALAAKLGPDHGALHADLVPKLRCAACGGKRISLTTLASWVPTWGGTT